MQIGQDPPPPPPSCESFGGTYCCWNLPPILDSRKEGKRMGALVDGKKNIPPLIGDFKRLWRVKGTEEWFSHLHFRKVAEQIKYWRRRWYRFFPTPMHSWPEMKFFQMFFAAGKTAFQRNDAWRMISDCNIEIDMRLCSWHSLECSRHHSCNVENVAIIFCKVPEDNLGLLYRLLMCELQ